MSYLVAAYAVLWAISFGLVFSMVWRQRKVQSELQSLRVLVEDLAYQGLAKRKFTGHRGISPPGK